MSTFTLQDLNLPATVDEAIKHVEANKAVEQVIQTRSIPNPQPLTKEQFMEYGLANPPNAEQILNNLAIPQAPEPQHTFVKVTLGEPKVEDIINAICTQLQLLTTVIGEQARGNSPNTTPPEGSSADLKDCVEQVLVQAGWFDALVAQHLNKFDFNEIVTEAVEDRVCSEVENYFSYTFEASDHFDIDDAVASRVDDALEDVVKDQLEELVAEKMRGMRVVFE